MSKTYQFKTKERMKKGIEIMKKTLAIILSVLMIVCMMPSMAFAATTLTDNNTVVSLSSVKFDYNGADQKPTVSVVYKGDDGTQSVPLKEDDDYTLSYSRNGGATPISSDPDLKSAGTIKIKIEGAGNYEGTLTERTYTISAKTLTNDMITIPAQQIDDTLKNNDIQVKDGTKSLVENVDYTVGTISKTVKDGNNSVSITGTGNYTGTINKSYFGGNLLEGKYKIVIGSYTHPTYNGQAQSIPTSSIKVVTNDSSETPLSSSYYDVSFKNNVNAGDATVVVTGRNGYIGSISANYTIDKRAITLCSISAPENWAAGESVDVMVKDGSKPLTKGIDYDIDTSSIANGSITIYGIGNYGGFKTLSVHTGISIRSASVTMYPNSFTYTGSACMPTFTVKLYSETNALISGVDYKIVYEKNINAGTATAKIIGIGKYAGTIERTFTISQKIISTVDSTLTMSSDSVYYNGKVQTPAVTVRCAGRILTKDVEYSVSYYNNTKIGTATVYIYGKGNYSGSLTKTFKILGKDISSANASLSQTSYNYDGLAKKPTVTMYDGTTRLSSGVDYSVDYKNNTNSGTASAIITGKGNYSGTKTLTFQIVGKDQTLTTNKTYYTKYLTSEPFNLQAKKDGDGTIVYTSSDTSVAKVSSTGTITICGTGEAVIKVETTGNIKYNPTSKNVYITVKPKTPNTTVTTPSRGRIKVKIKKVDGATKYQVKFGYGGKYKNKYLTHRDNEYTTISTTIKNCKSGKLYYVKVRAYKTAADGTKVYGNWTVKKIRVRW